MQHRLLMEHLQTLPGFKSVMQQGLDTTADAPGPSYINNPQSEEPQGDIDMLDNPFQVCYIDLRYEIVR